MDSKESKRKTKEESDQDLTFQDPVSLLSLFKYSSTYDRVLLCIGLGTTLITSLNWPILNYIFGNFVDVFIGYERFRKNATRYVVGSDWNGTTAEDDSTIGGLPYLTTEEFHYQRNFLCLITMVGGFAIFFANWCLVWSFNRAAKNITCRIKLLFFRSLIHQEISWFESGSRTGDFAHKLTADIQSVYDGIGEKVGMSVNAVMVTVYSLAVSFWYGWELTLVLSCIVPINIFVSAILSKIQAKVSVKETHALAEGSGVAEEVISGIRTVLAFGGQNKELDRYGASLQPARRLALIRNLLIGITVGFSWFAIYGGFTIGLIYSTRFYQDGIGSYYDGYTGGVITVILWNSVGGGYFFGQAAPFWEAIQNARACAGNIYGIIRRQPLINVRSNAGRKPETLHGRIEFQDVKFAYPSRDQVPILKGVSFTAEPGQTIALVGPSGSGKSTVLSLLQRFYDPKSGSILLDGIPIQDLNLGWMRDQIGVVTQEPILFDCSIAENIRIGSTQSSLTGENEKEDLKDIQRAARSANAHEFIVKLPEKYGTLVGGGGAQLSGGQKQRIAIARALVRKPKILLLDEATSALDLESESVVQVALDRARQGRTTLIVAHRLSTIQNADKIIVFNSGVIREVGTHQELINAKGLYFQLMKNQTVQSGYDKEDGDETEMTDEEREEKDDYHFDSTAIQSKIRKRNMSIKDAEHTRSPLNRTMSVGRMGVAEYSRMASILENSMDNDFEAQLKNQGPDRPSVPFSRLLKLMLTDKWALLSGLLSAMLMGMGPAAYAIIFGEVTMIFESNDRRYVTEQLFIFGGVFLAVGVINFFIATGQVYYFGVAGESLTYKLRKMAFQSILKQGIPFFDDHSNSVGALCSRLSSDAANVQSASGAKISSMVQAATTLVVAAIAGLYLGWKLGLVCGFFMPVIMLSVVLQNKLACLQMAVDSMTDERANKIGIEVIGNMRTVASLHKEEYFYKLFEQAAHFQRDYGKWQLHARGAGLGLGLSMPLFCYALALYYGSILVESGEVTYASVYKIIESMIWGAFAALTNVVFVADFQKAKRSVDNVFHLIDTEPKDAPLTVQIQRDAKSISSSGKCEGNIAMKDIRFSYPSRPRQLALDGLTFEANKGQTIALVGSSGSGKSTTVQLMEKYYTDYGGQITLDGKDLHNLDTDWVRSQMALVSQEPTLFSYSIAENIAYGDLTRHVTQGEIESAARTANIHDFVSTLPEGYNTSVGGRGSSLSGGQKQRVAIARALIRNPSILLLDEATSALDTESEKVVQAALDVAAKGRTSLVIAHRLSTIQSADKIIVMQHGRCMEQGTHEELLSKRGIYFQLYSLQAQSH